MVPVLFLGTSSLSWERGSLLRGPGYLFCLQNSWSGRTRGCCIDAALTNAWERVPVVGNEVLLFHLSCKLGVVIVRLDRIAQRCNLTSLVGNHPDRFGSKRAQRSSCQCSTVATPTRCTVRWCLVRRPARLRVRPERQPGAKTQHWDSIDRQSDALPSAGLAEAGLCGPRRSRLE